MKIRNVLVLKIENWVLIFIVFILISCNSQPNNSNTCENNWEGKVMTVKGLIPADSMGITLTHEHLLIEFSKDYMDLTDVATAISELEYYSVAGGRTLTDVTSIGLGRNPEALKQISEATGINIIMGAGFYKRYWLPDTIVNKSVEQLTQIIINDIINGINGVHAGVIGEIGMCKSSRRIAGIRIKPMNQFDKKLLIASAHAQKATGASIILHFDINEDAKARNYSLDILEKNGADLSKVSISHNTPYVDRVDDFISYAQRGCYVAFDNLGLEVYKPDCDRYYKNKLEPVKTIKALVSKGYIKNILLSQDIYRQALYVKNGGFGYAHVLNQIVPQLKAGGLTDEQIDTIIIENPKRLLSFKRYPEK
jgi:phosphotriesterase-related protein